MEKYEKKLKIRLAAMGVAMIVSIIMVVVSYFGYKKLSPDQHLASFINGVQLGLFLAWFIVMTVGAIRYVRALRNPKLLKRIYIKEHDERSILVQNKARSAGFWITLAGLLPASIIAGFYSVVVCFSLLSVFWFMCLSVGGAKIFFNKKL